MSDNEKRVGRAATPPGDVFAQAQRAAPKIVTSTTFIVGDREYGVLQEAQKYRATLLLREYLAAGGIAGLLRSDLTAVDMADWMVKHAFQLAQILADILENDDGL
jgi:hypothetical protein